MPAPATSVSVPLGNRPALDGVRALAMISVLVFHSRFTDLLSGGRIGVDLFFVLSGFLITTLLAEEWQREGRIDILAFYARRALRLGPALLALLVGSFALAFVPDLGDSTPTQIARFSVYVLTYTSNWVLASNSQHWPTLLGHLWSLAVEEQFYLVWPLVLVVALRRRVRPRTMIVMLLVAIAALSLWRAILWHRSHDVYRDYFATDCRANGLLIGAALGLLRAAGVRIGARLRLALVVAGTLLFVWTASYVDHQITYGVLLGLKRVELASVLLIAGLAMDDGDSGTAFLPARVFGCAFMAWIGRRSYAMYLWHLPMFYIATHRLPGGAVVVTIAAVAMTLAATMLSWHFVEQPALRHKARFERHSPVLVPSAA